MHPRGEAGRRAFSRYATAVAVAGGATFGFLLLSGGHGAWDDVADGPHFWALAAFVLMGELFPIRLPRRGDSDEITISSAFAFAVLLVYGIVPAMVVYAVASVIADAIARTSALKIAFNAGQYTLALVCAGLVLDLTASAPGQAVIDSQQLPGILLAATVCFGVNHLLAGTGGALLHGRLLSGYLREDLPFQIWTAGFLLALAPIVVASADHTLWLVPLLFFPMLGIYLGGRQAVLNNHRALHDELTELPNRALVTRLLGDRLAAGPAGERVATLIVDLDDFQAVNDTLGHRHGDLLLQAVAGRLEAALGESATLGRLGSDEFAVIVPGASPDRAEDSVGAVARALERPFDLEDVSLEVRASVGLALHPDHGDAAQDLLQHAEAALYRAKSTRAPYETYSPAHDGRHMERLALAGQLRRGIEAGELLVEYQPKLMLRPGLHHGAEALVRWQHPQLGLVGPGGFVPLAERTSLIRPVTLFVLETALSQARDWARAGLALRVAVNLSTRTLLDDWLVPIVDAALARYDLDGTSLQVEVTESQVLSDTASARAVLGELRARGVSVAIDDFGTGYSSLAQLQQLPADEIKIDKSFVIDMEGDESAAAIVRSTIDLGRNLGLRVTAEGVETEGALAQLALLGCDYVQGYHTGRPGAPSSCEREIRRHVGGRGRVGPERPHMPPVARDRLISGG
jgi:diguanylate cyclase (GGDEF)-like protein